MGNPSEKSLLEMYCGTESLPSAAEVARSGIRPDIDYHLYAYPTRTVVLYFWEKDKRYVAFDDPPEKKDNIILARFSEGQSAHRKNYCWSLPRTDALVKNHLFRAEKNNRVLGIEKDDVHIPISEIPGHSLANAIFGDSAQAYATTLQKQGYANALFQFLPDKISIIMDKSEWTGGPWIRNMNKGPNSVTLNQIRILNPHIVAACRMFYEHCKLPA